MDEAIRHLASIDRPSASPGERAAAEWIAASLRELGADAHVEQERAHGTYWWPLGLLNAVAIAAAALPRRAGRALAALSLAALADDLDHRSRWFRRAFLPQRPTFNVVAEAGDVEAARTLVVVAHHDAAHGGAVFGVRALELLHARRPGLYARFTRWPPLMWGVVLGPLLVLLGRRRAGAAASAAAIAAMADIARSPVAPGANDNLSSVGALLALAKALRSEPVDGLRVLLVSTGSEESNSEGMQAFGRRHFPELPRESTTIVTLECVGSGRLCLAESEGFLVPHAYDSELKRLAASVAERVGVPVRRGLHVSFASDGQIGLHAGYRSLLIGGIDELNLPANYHKPTDVPDNVQLGCVADAVRLTHALALELAGGQERARSERATATAS
jgi:Peptidase family M28